jgi:hypothetical protein
MTNAYNQIRKIINTFRSKGAIPEEGFVWNRNILGLDSGYRCYDTDLGALTISWPAGHILPTYKESFQVRWDNSIPLFLHAAIYLEVSLFRWTSQNAFSRETAVLYKWYCVQCCYDKIILLYDKVTESHSCLIPVTESLLYYKSDRITPVLKSDWFTLLYDTSDRITPVL